MLTKETLSMKPTHYEYMKENIRKQEILDKIKQLVIYRRGLEELIYSPEYYLFPVGFQAAFRSQMDDIEEYIEKNKNLDNV
jgi:hypothetical protein